MGRDASTSRFALPASALRCECVDDDSVLFGYHCQTCCALASTQPSPKTTQQRPSYETAQFACCRVEGAGSCRVALLSTINLPELNCRSGLSLPASPIAGICFPRAGAPVHVVDMRVEDALRTALDGGGLVGQASFVALTCLVSALYVRTVVVDSAIKPGRVRFAALSPVLVALTVAPYAFDLFRFPLLRGPLTTILSWWAATKVLSLSLGRGPLQQLVDVGRDSPLDLTAFLLLPAYPEHISPSDSSDSTGGSQEGSHHGRSHAGHRGSPTASGGAAHSSASTVASVSNAETTDGADGAGGKALGGREGAKVGAGDEVSGSSLTGRLLASLPHFPRMRLDVSEHQARFKADSLMVAVFWTTMLTATSVANLEFPNMHRHLKNTLGLTVMLGILGSVEAIASFLAKLLTGIDSVDSFDNPYLPFSLSDFWKRWNRFAGLLLKDIAFDPIIEGTLVKKRSGGPKPRRGPAVVAIATIATFFTSGVAHVWTMWHVTGQTPVIWVLFFSSHGVVLVFEGVIAGLFNSIVARRLSKEARERLRAPRGKKGKNRGLGFMYQEFGAFFPNPSVRMPLYCLYRLLCTTYVHVVCVLMAHVLRWWWWIEASGVESLLGEAIVRRAWDFLPGFARSFVGDRIGAFQTRSGVFCPTTWLDPMQAKETCTALAQGRLPTVLSRW